MASISSMLITLAPSLPYLEKLVTGFAYMLGICFIIYALDQVRDLSWRRTKRAVKGGFYGPVAYFLSGSALLFLPTFISVMEETLFGYGSPLSYSSSYTTQINTTTVTAQIVQLAGVVWVIRGCSLIASSSDPRVGHGKRGFLFVLGGILSINFMGTFALIQNTMQTFVQGTYKLYPLQQTIKSMFH